MNASETFTVHAAHPAGGEGYVLLLYRPDAEGRVRWREWSSDDYVGAPREGSWQVDEIEARVRQWARDGHDITAHCVERERDQEKVAWARCRSVQEH